MGAWLEVAWCRRAVAVPWVCTLHARLICEVVGCIFGVAHLRVGDVLRRSHEFNTDGTSKNALKELDYQQSSLTIQIIIPHCGGQPYVAAGCRLPLALAR